MTNLGRFLRTRPLQETWPLDIRLSQDCKRIFLVAIKCCSGKAKVDHKLISPPACVGTSTLDSLMSMLLGGVGICPSEF
jgi:hypothetical protein